MAPPQAVGTPSGSSWPWPWRCGPIRRVPRW